MANVSSCTTMASHALAHTAADVDYFQFTLGDDATELGRPVYLPLGFEDRMFLFALASGLPGTVFTLLLVWLEPHSLKLRWTVTLVLLFFWTWLAMNLRDQVVRPLQTLANLLSALREGDFSLRARQPQEPDALGQVVHEVNAIGEILREQRLGAVEAAALLHRVMEEVDVAVFAFDHESRLRLVNPAGERLLARLQRGIVPCDDVEIRLDVGSRTLSRPLTFLVDDGDAVAVHAPDAGS